MKSFLFITVVSLSTLCFAATEDISQDVQCPAVFLQCQHSIVNEKGIPVVTETKTAKFVAVNNDEPSLPANQCELSLMMTTSDDNINFHASLEDGGKDNMKLFTYVNKYSRGRGKYNTGRISYSLMQPQFSANLSPGQSVETYLGSDTYSCELK